ncbi:MAG TPA: sulfurtransferase [Dehalococcoidia bacterium]|nr:sulfurtransferase [Dehalococcoidia bacterium]
MVDVGNVLVETDWLAAHLDDRDLRVADCRFSFDYDASRDYHAGHIPGAVYVRLQQDLATPNGPVHFALPPPEQFAASMERLGIGDRTVVVAYDDQGGHFASRFWLCMAFYGHGSFRILNGGLTKWVAEGRPVVTAAPQPRSATFTAAVAAPELRMTAEQVMSAIGTPGTTIVDVRRDTEFRGEEVRAKRGGHIPSAIHALWQENLNWEGDRTFKSAETISDRYKRLGVGPDQKIITYCQGGVRASHSALALLLAGYRNVSVYDGSWDDWGNRDDVPIERS